MAAWRPIQGKILSTSESDCRSGKEEINVTERHLDQCLDVDDDKRGKLNDSVGLA